MSFRVSLAAAFALTVVCSNSAVLAAPRTFVISDDKNRDTVIFTSDAPLELINGHTNKIEGSITLDDSMDLTEALKCSFNVDLASIDTGIPLRNEHMRDNFLETKKYPKASFVLKKLLLPANELKANRSLKLIPGQKATLKALGDFSCHGKTVSKTIPVEVTYFTKCPSTESKRPGCDLIQLKATFPVYFKDHEIKRPEVVFQKLADTVIVTVSATAYNQIAGTGSKDTDSATGNKAK